VLKPCYTFGDENVRSAGAALQACRRVDVEAWRHGGMELWRRAAGVATGRYGGIERCKCASGMYTWKYGSMEL